MATLTVHVDMSKVPGKLDKISNDKKLGQYIATQGMKFMNDNFVPYRDGALRKSAVATPFKITWNTPYAHRHWSGFGDDNRTTEGTVSHWETPKQRPKVVRDYIASEAQDYLRTH